MNLILIAISININEMCFAFLVMLYQADIGHLNQYNVDRQLLKELCVALQGIEAGAWTDCNWTGCGNRVDIKLDGQPAMPDGVFTDPIRRLVRRKLKAHINGSWEFLRRSIVQRWKVNNVALKPILDPFRHPEVSRVLLEFRDGLSFFDPMDIVSQNVGSDRGLMLILKQISEERREMMIACNSSVQTAIYS